MSGRGRARKFAGAPFGPMTLRKLVRERFEPGECLVGWGVARVDPSFAVQAMVALLSVLPGAGMVMAAEIARMRLLVLSDRRLWVIDPRARPALRGANLVEGELRLSGVEVELVGSARTAPGVDHFEQHPFRANIRAPGARSLGVRLTVGKRDAARRLVEAFRVLARGEAGGGPGGYAGRGA